MSVLNSLSCIAVCLMVSGCACWGPFVTKPAPAPIESQECKTARAYIEAGRPITHEMFQQARDAGCKL